ncbi:MAG: ribonuclease E/G [Hyphomonas sp.]
MSVTRILREKAIGETRWVAYDASDRPIALRLDRWSDQTSRAQVGTIAEGRIRAIHERQGGAFVELSHGTEAFVRLNDGHGLTEGQSIEVQTVAEARRGKLARVVRVESREKSQPRLDPVDVWQKSLPLGTEVKPENVPAGDPEIQAAFDDALSESVTLPGGGTLQIQPTAALVAVDLDTSGRNDGGRAAARALRINLEACRELARQMNLRNLGGAVVLDCVSPINREAGIKIRDGFLSAFADLSQRQVKALAPSPFGLMEASVAWGETPIADRMLGADGLPTDETVCLEGLRHLQREARAQPMARFQLNMPARAHSWMTGSGLDLQASLDESFGARLTISPHTKSKPEVFQI